MFLKLITKNEASDNFTQELLFKIANVKQNAQWRHSFMEYERQRAYDEERGMEKNAIEDAIVLIKDFNITPELAYKK